MDLKILCNNGTFKKQGIELICMCNKDNLPCTNCRWCINEQCIKMKTDFTKCKNYNIENK